MLVKLRRQYVSKWYRLRTCTWVTDHTQTKKDRWRLYLIFVVIQVERETVITLSLIVIRMLSLSLIGVKFNVFEGLILSNFVSIIIILDTFTWYFML